MRRVAVIVINGLLLAGCGSLSSLQIPGFNGESSPTPITLNLESDPAGAEATLSAGGSCNTPCALPVTATTDVTATFTLANHQSRTLTAKVVAAEKNLVGMESSPARLEPNPLHAKLQPEPPKRKRRPAVKRPQAAAGPPPAVAAPAASSPASAPAPSSPSVAPAAPWPAPR